MWHNRNGGSANMDKAKSMWLLSNGELVSVGKISPSGEFDAIFFRIKRYQGY